MPGNERANTRPYWQKEGRPGSPAIDKAMPQAVQFITDMLCVSPKDRPFWSAGKRQTRRKKSLLRQRSRFLGAETAAVLCPLQRSIRIRRPGAEASGARIHGPYPTEKPAFTKRRAFSARAAGAYGRSAFAPNILETAPRENGDRSNTAISPFRPAAPL